VSKKQAHQVESEVMSAEEEEFYEKLYQAYLETQEPMDDPACDPNKYM